MTVEFEIKGVEDDEIDFIFDPEYYRAQQRKGNITVSVNPVQLKAKVLSLSQTGNLTIVFNKPIYLPPIEIYQNEPVTRLLTRSYTI